ncbi:MAG: CIA30 family protein [Pseudomonadota bacterium]
MLITDFTGTSPNLGWRVVNDNVMGGRSDGDFAIVDKELRFTGRTNTRGGGFSSIRSQRLALNLSAFAGLRVRVRADGRRYTWRLTTDARVYGRQVSYWADFETTAGEWQDIDIAFSDFIPQFRGRLLDGPTLDTSNIQGMGLMIYDKLDGPFDLQLASVHAFAEPFSIQALRWDKRVLIVNAASANSEALQQQLMAIDATAQQFNERDMVLVTLVTDNKSKAGARDLNASDVDALRRSLSIDRGEFAVRLVGKDGSVKLTANEPVATDELYALIDKMPMRRREMQDD